MLLSQDLVVNLFLLWYPSLSDYYAVLYSLVSILVHYIPLYPQLQLKVKKKKKVDSQMVFLITAFFRCSKIRLDW